MSVSMINGHIDRGSMTPQEALAWVEDYEKAIKEEQAIVNNGDEFHVEALRVCEVVKQALEKQIPKKATNKEYVPNGKLVYGHCPVSDTFTNNCRAYCNKYGQALDWSDIE